MKKRAAALGLALVFTATVGPAVAATHGSTLPEIQLHAARWFSPNDDGVKDRAVVRYTLAKASKQVTVSVLRDGFAFRVKDLGAQEAGTHVWRWDGRRGNGEPASDGRYAVRVTADYSSRTASARRLVTLDTRFSARMLVERYGGASSASNKVYPRSTELRDKLPLTAVAERSLDRGSLIIRNEAGRVVLRRDIKDGDPGINGWVLDVAWTGRMHGKPLAVGRYQAVVSGNDKAGNHGRSKPVSILVSRDRLVWRDETRVLPAEGTTVGCEIFSGNDCALSFYCGEVLPSNLFVGGLSLQSQACPPGSNLIPEAASWHLVSAPDAVHGIRLARVAFAGSPTHAGETDPGTLTFGEIELTSASGAQSEWIEPPLGNGRVWFPDSPRLPPSVFWTFGTTGDDAFDVATFTVDLHYAAVE